MQFELDELLTKCNEHLEIMRRDTIAKWSKLRATYHFLAKYSTYENFENDCTWAKLGRSRKTLYNALLRNAASPDNLLHPVLLLLFSHNLCSIIDFVYQYYRYYYIIEDTWSIIVEEFFDLMISCKPPFPIPSDIIKDVRTATGSRLRSYVRDVKHKEKKKDWLPLLRADEETPEQLKVYYEIMDILKSRLKADEYSALCLRIEYEFYDRHKKPKDLCVARNINAERRATRKSKEILIAYYKKARVLPKVLEVFLSNQTFTNKTIHPPQPSNTDDVRDIVE